MLLPETKQLDKTPTGAGKQEAQEKREEHEVSPTLSQSFYLRCNPDWAPRKETQAEPRDLTESRVWGS